ncbi:hypothetical protein Tco_0313059 [Tanacetum coccineum]
MELKVNAARHNLLLLLKVNAARHNLQLKVNVNAIEGIFINTLIKATVKVKTVNGEVQLQALVVGKKIIVTKASVRRYLQLNDEEGTKCLPNATIFEELTRMGYEKLSQKLTFYKAFFSPQWKFIIHTILQCLSAKNTAWNEFRSTMASAIICLATNQKFNFSKYIFESMVKNLENVSGKFLLYPRFVQVFLEKQLEGMSNHKRIYVTPSHTKKIFGNIRRVGKGFSRRDTPLLPTMMVQAQQKQGEGSVMPTDPQHTPTIIQPLISQPQLKQRSRRPKRKDTEVPQPNGPTSNVADKAVNEEMDDSLVRAATTATILDAEQDRGNINKTQSKATPNEPSSLGTSSGGGPKRQETMGDRITQTRFENVSKTSNDSLLAGVNTPRSDEDRLKLNELMEFCTKLQQIVLDLENTKTAQAQEITSLKLRVKKLEKKGGSRTHKLKRLYNVGRSARVISSDEAKITLVHETQGRYGDEEIFDTCVLDDEEVFAGQDMAKKEINVAEKEVSTGDPVTTAGKVVTTASVEISTASPTDTTITDELTLAQTLIEIRSAKPKVKGVVIGEHSESTTRTRPQQLPSKDKGKGIMVVKPVKMKKKDQISLDEELAFKLQAEEEEERLAREKAQREEEANIVSWDNVQAMIDLFDKAMKRVNTFVDMDTELVEGSEVRAEGSETRTEGKVVPNKEEVAIDVILLATKPPSIVDYKIYKEGKKTYYQIIKADGSSKMYLVFSHMLKSFDREDLETL